LQCLGCGKTISDLKFITSDRFSTDFTHTVRELELTIGKEKDLIANTREQVIIWEKTWR